MKFSNHCTAELLSEAKKVIANANWHPSYKSQLLSRVHDVLEAGQWIRTNTGGFSVPFEICDVESLVGIVSDRD
jgi:hypothetical protein